MKIRTHESINSSHLSVVPGLVSASTLFVAFTLMALEFEYFWVTFILGFGVVLPVAAGMSHHVLDGRQREASDDTANSADEDAALAQLRQRYARGELSDSEFEHRLERLLEAESQSERQDTAAGLESTVQSE